MNMRYTCGIFLIDSHQKILLVHPTGHGPASWSIPKGCAEPGESYLDAAQRELQEETGLWLPAYAAHITQVRLLSAFPYGRTTKTLIPFAVWLDCSLEDVPLRCDLLVDDKFPENDAFEWVTLPELFTRVHHTQRSAAYLLRQYW